VRDVKEVARVQGVVAKVIEKFAVNFVGTRTSSNVGDGSGSMTYSALNVELLALNSETVLIEGWKVRRNESLNMLKCKSATLSRSIRNILSLFCFATVRER